MVIDGVVRLYLGHDRVSLFPSNPIEAAQDLQHKWPGGMEAIRQSFLYDTGTNAHTLIRMSIYILL